MNAPVAPAQSASAATLIALAALALLGIGLWLLYEKAEAISPVAHHHYLQSLRTLREYDARSDRELLANRQELVRNYDALTRYLELTLATAAEVRALPAFLRKEDRQRLSLQAAQLEATLADKAEQVDRFKRIHAVLRNSLTFFPIAAQDILDRDAGRLLRLPERSELGRFVRAVLDFARAPSESGRAAILDARRRIDPDAYPAATRPIIKNLLSHGAIIAEHQLELDRLTLQIFALESDRLAEALEQGYARAHAAAAADAERYRRLVYGLALLLAAFFIWAVIRLERTRRSLAMAHAELSARYQAQLAAEKQLKLHATAFQSAHDGITLTDAQGNILDVNPAFSRITGYTREEVIGRNPRMLKSGRHDREFYAAMWKSILDTGNWRGEIWNRNKYGEIYPELLSISAVRDESGRITNYVAVFADISRLKAQEKQLAKMAYYDALTDLPNRVLLSDRLEQGIQQTRRMHTLMAVCYLDLDGFKAINDSLGHEAGDQLLIEVAARLKASLRAGDTIARLGGDEFVLLLLSLSDPQECSAVLDRVLNVLGQPFLIAQQSLSLSASIGVTFFPQDDSDADTLLRHADQAMYIAKQTGKNRYHIFDVAHDHSQRTRQHRLGELREALQRGEFVLHYQPKVDMRQGRVIGAEALLRWNHPQRGLVPPIEFLPLLENDDLIRDIGDWVIENALAQMVAWLREGLVLPVSVNVASRQLQQADFTERLKQALSRHAAVAGQLELEVLETTALEDIARVSHIIDECHALGVEFALDDFGTGYSSLTYLKRLPTRTIKIDQSFVREILNDTNNLVIVEGVIGLAHAFRRRIIAEGVETAEHGRLLLQLECDHAQGYGIARPMPAAELPAWIRQWRPDPSWQRVSGLRWGSEDHPLLAAEIEHRNWVAQIVFTTQEGRPVPHVLAEDHTACQFGRWYYAEAPLAYRALPVFAQVEAPHRRVHEIAAAIDRDWREGRLDAARARLPALLAARDAVLEAIQALELAVAKPR